MTGHWKVPFRSVYCETFGDMLRQAFWCHVVIRVFPHARDLASDALVDLYLKEHCAFFEQYEHVLREVARERRDGGSRPRALVCRS